MDKINILLTGSNGYIASSITKHLNKQYNFTTIHRSIFDLTDSYATKKWFDSLDIDYFDAVIHTAIKGGNRLENDSSSVLDNNLKMYLNLLDHRHRYKKFINIGSGAERCFPDSFYGLSKKAIGHSILDKKDFYNLKIYGIFDEYELDRRFIKSNIIRYLNNKKMLVHSNKCMDFIYMLDFIKIVQKYIDYENMPKTLDCVYEKKYSLIDIAHIINSLGDHSVAVDLQNKNNDPDYTGHYHNVHIRYSGLEYGIAETYRRIQNEKNMVRSK